MTAEVDFRSDESRQYDRYYQDGPSEWRALGALDKAANIVALCRDVAASTVLEIGAGDGAILSHLSDQGFGSELYAVEISASGVSVIRGRAIPRLAECRLFDGYRLPYDARRFDIAILSHVVEHAEHPRAILREAARVARHVFVEVPTEDISRRPKDYTPNSVGHINFFSPRTIRWLVQSSGLRVLKQVTTTPSKAVHMHRSGRKGLAAYHAKRALLRMAPTLATRHFCYHEALLATGGTDSAPDERDAAGSLGAMR